MISTAPCAADAFVGVRQPTFDTCLPACIATILGLSIKQVPTPRFDLGSEWTGPYNEALREAIGYETVWPCDDFLADPHGLWVAIVPSLTMPERGNHAVVMRDDRLLWDPAQSHLRTAVELVDVIDACRLVPLWPSGPPGSRPPGLPR